MTVAPFADEWDDDQLWASPELTADLVEFLGTGALDACRAATCMPAMTGGGLVAEQAGQILADDRLALRLREHDAGGRS